jgi:hypothetical protein
MNRKYVYSVIAGFGISYYFMRDTQWSQLWPLNDFARLGIPPWIFFGIAAAGIMWSGFLKTAAHEATIRLADNQATWTKNAQTQATRKCPFCAELIKWEAVVCKHCGRDIGKPTPVTLNEIRRSDAQAALNWRPPTPSRTDPTGREAAGWREDL